MRRLCSAFSSALRKHSQALVLLVLLLSTAPLQTSAAGQSADAAQAATTWPKSLSGAFHVATAALAPLAASSQQQQQVQQPPAAAAAAAATAAAAAGTPAAEALQQTQASTQHVADVLVGMYQSYAKPVMKAAANFLEYGLVQAEKSAVKLPQCKQTNVLLNAGQFPGKSWAKLTAEQQVFHPVNLVMMQVAYMAYRPLSDLNSCLTGMGADLSSLRNLTLPVNDFSTFKTAYVFRAGKERVFLTFRGSCESDLAINIDCRQEEPSHELFGVSGGPQIKLHRGYWRAWQALEKEALNAVQELLKEVPSREVYVVGHSLGAAIASIAAMRLNALLPGGVSGAFLYAAPRAGNAAWAAAYNRMMLHKTVRFSNYLDFAVRVPSSLQSCSLGSMSLRAETGRFDYAHVGRAVLLCPERDTGLSEFRVSPHGSDNLDCFGNDEVDATAATHQLGSYFDAWRRGYLKYKGDNLAKDVRVEAVMCEGCTVNTQRYKMEQLRCPARAGVPVTCTVDASCSSDAAFSVTLAVGSIVPFRAANTTTCQAYMCQAAAVAG